MPAKKIDISPGDLGIVRGILRKRVPDREVRAFGSRVTGRNKEFSDLDIAVMGTEPVGDAVKADMAEDFKESDLPFKVDVIVWAKTKANFRRIIEKKYVILQKRK